MFGAVTVTIAVPAAGAYYLPDHPSVHLVSAAVAAPVTGPYLGKVSIPDPGTPRAMGL